MAVFLAERQGFEPWDPLRGHGLAIRSVTTPAPLLFRLQSYNNFFIRSRDFIRDIPHVNDKHFAICF